MERLERVLVFDCRSYTAFYRFLSLRSRYFKQYSYVVIVFPECLDQSLLANWTCSDKRVIFKQLPVNADDISCLKFGITRLADFFGELSSDESQVDFLTSFPRGVLYFVVYSLTLNHKDVKIFCLDDGFANSLATNYERPSHIGKRIKFFLLGMSVDLAIVKFLGYFNLAPVDRFFTVYGEAVPPCFADICVDVSSLYASYYRKISKTFEVCNDSVLLLGHHAVQSKRLSKHQYEKLILKAVHKYLGSNNIFVSSHHAERKENAEFYESLGLRDEMAFLPAEVLVASGCFSVVIAPFNTTLIECAKLGLVAEIKKFVGYVIPGSDLIEERMCQTKSVCERSGISFSVVR